MKKSVSMFLTVIMLFGVMAGCSVSAKANTALNNRYEALSSPISSAERYSNSGNTIVRNYVRGTELSGLTAGNKSINVKWKKQSKQTSGYKIQYATDKKFTKNKKTITVSKGKTSKKITGLKANKKYYVRIRTYRKNNSKCYYSSWSSIKSATTKGSTAAYCKLQCECSMSTGKILGEKVGNYYYYVLNDYESNNDYLLKRKSEDEEPTELLVVDRSEGYELYTRNIVTNGSTMYYVVYSNNDCQSTIYKMNTSGEGITEIYQENRRIELTGFYNNCFYYVTYDFGTEEVDNSCFCKYNVKTKEAETIYENAVDMTYGLASNGRYMVFRRYLNAYENVPITVYDAKEGKKTVIENGLNAGISGSKIYYCTLNMGDDYDYYSATYALKCCDMNGKNKKTVSSDIPVSYLPAYLCKNGMYCIGCDDNYNETDYFFSYNDKTMKKI